MLSWATLERIPTPSPVKQASVNFLNVEGSKDAPANSGETPAWCWACPWVSDGRKRHPGIESGPALIFVQDTR